MTGLFDYWDAVEKLLVAAALGAVIGVERDVHGRAAGMRTHMLVCMGAALFMIISRWLPFLVDPAGKGDAGRIAAQVVSGIGFLGAGVIIKEGFSVRGLTTAACLWTMAAVGLAVGCGYYALAATATGIALVCLIVFVHLERVYPKVSYFNLALAVKGPAETTKIIQTLGLCGLKVNSCEYDRDLAGDTTTLRMSVRRFHRGFEDTVPETLPQEFSNAGIALRHFKIEHV